MSKMSNYAIEIENLISFLKHEYSTSRVEFNDGTFDVFTYYQVPCYDDGGSVDSIGFEEEVNTYTLQQVQEYYDSFESKMCEAAEYCLF